MDKELGMYLSHKCKDLYNYICIQMYMLVSNTSTLVLLAKVDCLEAFIDFSPTIEIPSQVKEEALFERDSYYSRVIRKFIESEKIKVKRINEVKLKIVLSEFRLDEGEAAAYLLFDNKKHNAILTDDGELIKLCKLQNIPFICAMAIIIRMYEKKLLTKNKTLEKLEELNKIGRYSKEIYKHFMMEVI